MQHKSMAENRTAHPLRVYSRKRIDISYSSLLRGLLYCLPAWPSPPHTQQDQPHWNKTMITSTARAALSALLSALNLPTGSEILVSAITIPSIPSLLRAHGLVPVPLDTQPDTTISPQTLTTAITPRTKMVVVAQLFGARWDISALCAAAHAHNLLFVEDCAQAFAGAESLSRQSSADVTLFSFGTIKTCSALGGGAASVPRDAALLRRMEEVQRGWETQSTTTFAKRVARYAVLKTVADSPLLYGLLLLLLAAAGIDSGAFITNLGRNVDPVAEILPQIQKRPCGAQIRLLRSVVGQFDPGRLRARAAMVKRLAQLLPAHLRPVGLEARRAANARCHWWLCPIRVREPRLVVRKLLEIGVDAADGGTSLFAVQGGEVVEAKELMDEVMYLPIDHAYRFVQLVAIAKVFEAYGDGEPQSSEKCHV